MYCWSYFPVFACHGNMKLFPKTSFGDLILLISTIFLFLLAIYPSTIIPKLFSAVYQQRSCTYQMFWAFRTFRLNYKKAEYIWDRGIKCFKLFDWFHETRKMLLGYRCDFCSYDGLSIIFCMIDIPQFLFWRVMLNEMNIEMLNCTVQCYF